MAINIKELKSYSSTIDWLFSTPSDVLILNDVNTNLTIKFNETHLASYETKNDTITDEPYEDYKYRPETYMVPIIFSLIFIIGVLGNGTLIVVFIKHRAMRNVPNT